MALFSTILVIPIILFLFVTFDGCPYRSRQIRVSLEVIRDIFEQKGSKLQFIRRLVDRGARTSYTETVDLQLTCNSIIAYEETFSYDDS